MTSPTLDYELQKLIRMLPGYDPFTQGADYVFDEGRARHAIGFIQDCCTFTKGTRDGKPLAGEPFILEDWEKAIVANLFGWVHKTSGLRRYRECLLFLPRKNGKSELAAAILVYMICTAAGVVAPGSPLREPGAEFYGAAGKRDQTKYIFDPVKKMLLAEPRLHPHVQPYQHSVVVGDACYLKISSEATTEHGGSTHCAVVDELHAQPKPELVEVLQTSMASREQPLLLHVTTSDYEREGSICNDKHDYASKVRDNLVDDPAFLPVIYEASREDDWTDPKIWAMSNPNLGVSVRLEHLERECKRAQADPGYENTFKRLHLNIRTEQAFRLIPLHLWDACDQPVDIPAGASVVIGLDGASVKDMASVVVCYDDGERFHFRPFFWCPNKQVRDLEAQGNHTYAKWVNQGFLYASPGNSIDHRAIRKEINDLAAEYDVQEVAFDPDNLRQLATELLEEDGIQMVEHRQGSRSMNEPMKLLVRMILDKRICHGGHPILRWNMANLAAKKDSYENIHPDKAESGGKIDGAVGAIMAIGRADAMIMGESFYEEHGVEFSKKDR